MNHDRLKTIIFDQHEVIRNTTIIERDYFFEENANYVLVGLRRSGKSTMLYNIAKNLVLNGTDWNQIIYINFEDERLSEFSITDFNDILEVSSELSDKKSVFFLDEIQIIPGWEKFARRMADSKELTYITGSNANMLSSEIETTLGGRYLTKFIYPYNVREFLLANEMIIDEKSMLQTKTIGKIKRLFDDYYTFGGFPETVLYKNKREYISRVYQKILLGDIATRNNIRNSAGLKILIKKIAETVKDTISYSKLYNILKTVGVGISKDVIIDYIKYAQDSYLIFAIRNYVAKFAEKETTPKYYFSDNGLLSLFLNKSDSALLENLIAIKLFQNNPNDIYYLKSEKTNIDIDFFIPETETAIQVAYSISKISNNREIESLVKLASEMDEVKNFIIITKEEEQILEVSGITIKVIPALKWLLQ